MRAAVDVGFGYVKGLADHGGRFRCPAVLAPDEGDEALDRLWGEGVGTDRVRITTESGISSSWLVGATAASAPGATRPWAADATHRVGYDILVATALAGMAPPGPDTVSVDLVLGLPLGLFSAQQESLAAAFRGHRWSVTRGQGRPVTLHIQSVLVAPQAAGAYYAEALTPTGGVRDSRLLHQPVGVVDVGFRTTDYFLMAWDDNRLHPVRGLSGSLDSGYVDVLEAVRRRAAHTIGQMVDPMQVESALRQGSGCLYAADRTVDLRSWAREAGQAAGRRVADQVRLVWGQHLLTIGTVLLAGGGATALKEPLLELHPGARLVEDPMFANARGFLGLQAVQRSEAALG